MMGLRSASGTYALGRIEAAAPVLPAHTLLLPY